MKGRRQYFLGGQLHRFIGGHNRDARGRASGYSIHRHREPRDCHRRRDVACDVSPRCKQDVASYVSTNLRGGKRFGRVDSSDGIIGQFFTHRGGIIDPIFRSCHPERSQLIRLRMG